MKWIIGIIIVYAIYFLVVTVLELMKKGKTKTTEKEETIIVAPEQDEAIQVVGEYEKKK